MTIRDFCYTVSNPWIWGIILLIAIRAMYKCAIEKDYAHTFAFLPIAVGSLYMLGVSYGIFGLPDLYK